MGNPGSDIVGRERPWRRAVVAAGFAVIFAIGGLSGFPVTAQDAPPALGTPAAGTPTVGTPAIGTPLSATPAPDARTSPADIGLVDAASRSMWNVNDPTALVYQLNVLVFDTPERARAAFDLVTAATTAAVSATPVAGTPGGAPVPVTSGASVTAVALGDAAQLYYQPDETGAAGIAILFLLDGTALHQWSTLPVPLQENVLLIDPVRVTGEVQALATTWFATDRVGPAPTLLPGLEQLPAGYSVFQETSGLTALTGEATPVAIP